MYDVSCKQNIAQLKYLFVNVIFKLNSKNNHFRIFVYIKIFSLFWCEDLANVCPNTLDISYIVSHGSASSTVFNELFLAFCGWWADYTEVNFWKEDERVGALLFFPGCDACNLQNFISF